MNCNLLFLLFGRNDHAEMSTPWTCLNPRASSSLGIDVAAAFSDQPAVDSTRVYFKAPGEDAYGFLLMQRADAQYVAGESPSRSPLSSVTTSIRTWSAPGAGEALPP